MYVGGRVEWIYLVSVYVENPSARSGRHLWTRRLLLLLLLLLTVLLRCGCCSDSAIALNRVTQRRDGKTEKQAPRDDCRGRSEKTMRGQPETIRCRAGSRVRFWREYARTVYAILRSRSSLCVEDEKNNLYIYIYILITTKKKFNPRLPW